MLSQPGNAFLRLLLALAPLELNGLRDDANR